MKLCLLVLVLVFSACSKVDSPIDILSQVKPKSNSKVLVVAGYEFAVGDEMDYIKALLGEPISVTENIHGEPIWRFAEHNIELRFDNDNRLKSWTDTSYLP